MTLIRQGLRAERASTEPAARVSVIAQIFRRRGEGRLRLRRVAEVPVVEATDLGQGDHAAVLRWLDRARLRCILLEREMRPRAVVVAQVALQTTSQMSLVQDDDVVEKLAADGADHPLGERVLPGGAWCRKNLSDAHALHPSPKLATVDAISIAEEVAWRRIVGKGFDNLLRRPSGSGRVRDVEVYDSSAMVQQDHEHVEDSECHSRHDEEVDGDKIGDVIFEEGPPGLRGRFRTARPTNRALRDVETELEELAMNARRTPEGIGEDHGADELGDLQIDGRTTGSAASRLPVPEHTEALPVPANHGLRLNDMERFAPHRQNIRRPAKLSLSRAS